DGRDAPVVAAFVVAVENQLSRLSRRSDLRRFNVQPGVERQRSLKRREDTWVRLHGNDAPGRTDPSCSDQREISPVRTYIHARVARPEQGREQQRLLCFVAAEKEDLTRKRVPQVAPEPHPSRFEAELRGEGT